MRYECLLNYLYENGYCEDCVEPYPAGKNKISVLPKDIENQDDLMIAEWNIDLPKPTEKELIKKKYQDTENKKKLRDKRYKINRLKEHELYPIFKLIFKKLNVMEEEIAEAL